MKKILSLLIIIALISSCTTTKGYNYKAHSKHNTQLKHKA